MLFSHVVKAFLFSVCFFAAAGYLLAVLLGKVEGGGIQAYIQQLIEPPQGRFEAYEQNPSPLAGANGDEELKLLRGANPYPVKLRIKNMDGQVLNIRLTGRSESNISFMREDDKRRFVYSIDDLDSASRKKVRKYPALGIAGASSFLNKGLNLDEVHAEQLRLRAERLSELMREAQADAAISVSEVEQRTLRRKYEEYRAERLKILKDLN